MNLDIFFNSFWISVIRAGVGQVMASGDGFKFGSIGMTGVLAYTYFG